MKSEAESAALQKNRREKTRGIEVEMDPGSPAAATEPDEADGTGLLKRKARSSGIRHGTREKRLLHRNGFSKIPGLIDIPV